LTEYEPQRRVEEQKTYFVEQRRNHFLPVGFAVALVFLSEEAKDEGVFDSLQKAVAKGSVQKEFGQESDAERFGLGEQNPKGVLEKVTTPRTPKGFTK